MIAVAMAKYLDAQGLLSYEPASATGDTFIGHLPSSPDVAVMVMPYDAEPLPERGSLPWDEPILQLMVRGAPDDPITPYATARALYEALQGLRYTTFDEGGDDQIFVVSARCLQSDAFHLDVDENRRHRYVVNVAVHVRAATAHRE